MNKIGRHFASCK